MPEGGGAIDGLTRREALKRGLAAGGALLWATPVVQTVGMSRAVASDTSPHCRTYCVKYEFLDNDDDSNLDGSWSELGNGRGNCLVCPPDAENDALPASFFDGFEVYGGTKTTSVYVRFPDSCTLADLEDPSPDLFYPGVTVAVKCGQDCRLQSPVEEADPEPGYTRVGVDACANGRAISHIELIISCCS